MALGLLSQVLMNKSGTPYISELVYIPTIAYNRLGCVTSSFISWSRGSFDSASTTSLAVLALLLSLLSLLLPHVLRRNPKIHLCQRHIAPETLQAICAVVTPTACASPLSYAALLQHTEYPHLRRIDLRLSTLIAGICTGEIELRDSLNDLPDLLRGKLRIYGWNICLDLEKRWWIEVVRWIASQYLQVSQTIYGVATPCLTQAIAPADPQRRKQEVARYNISGNKPPIRAELVAFDLDFISYHRLEAELSVIHLRLGPDSSKAIEFSCLAPGIGFLTHDFVLCAIPFLPTTYRTSKTNTQVSHTTTPLFVSLNSVIASLSSGPWTIKSIQNISNLHALALDKLGQDLLYDKAARSAFIEGANVAAWREKIFRLAWEAALLRAGLLMRWRVILMV
ncbi:hypothetical protein B0H34DRAFT_837142 [Crassisporium funariophilum]|nr:hypothetical protein B0H34DRAFT_837142 [Crassisporium funariophilum]